MSGIVERIRSRPNDAPMPTEHLLDEAAGLIEELAKALDVALETLQVEGCCGAECMSCTEARATLAKVQS